MNSSDQATESATTVAAKLGPPATVSLATVMGVQVSDLVLWATLIYTVLLIGHKVYQIYKDVTRKDDTEE
jgi:hypothetical protein